MKRFDSSRNGESHMKRFDPQSLTFDFLGNVLGVTSSTVGSLSKVFAELSTDGQFLLRERQAMQFFKESKPVESARQNGHSGFTHGMGGCTRCVDGCWNWC